MTFTSTWGSAGIYFNGMGINLFSDPNLNGRAPTFKIDWGDGQSDTVAATSDTNGDGIFDSGSVFHSYGSDGVYDIVARSAQSGLPAVHMRAFCDTSQTADLVINAPTNITSMVLSGNGNDTIHLGDAGDWAFGRDGNDTIVGGAGFNFIGGEVGDDVIKGGAGGDLLTGGDGNDNIHGGDDGDSIFGDANDDKLFGDAGNDYLDGGTGRDTLTGGADGDIFSYDTLTSATKVDRGTITDFTQGQDHIWLHTDAGSFTFVGQNAFDKAGPEARYETSGSTTTLFVDTDGNGKTDFSVKLAGVVNLTSNDFYFSGSAAEAAKGAAFAHSTVHIDDLSMHGHAIA